MTKLADDLDDMQRYLDRQVKRMDSVVDAIEARWQGLRPRRTDGIIARRPRKRFASGSS
ncbi:hypothetical protein [Streptomyces niveus]|uniref:hypothetical protein n=1 Tax=Streptomyces niveus TaxID=193462 RepID=UPI003649739D